MPAEIPEVYRSKPRAMAAYYALTLLRRRRLHTKRANSPGIACIGTVVSLLLMGEFTRMTQTEAGRPSGEFRPEKPAVVDDLPIVEDGRSPARRTKPWPRLPAAGDTATREDMIGSFYFINAKTLAMVACLSAASTPEAHFQFTIIAARNMPLSASRISKGDITRTRSSRTQLVFLLLLTLKWRKFTATAGWRLVSDFSAIVTRRKQRRQSPTIEASSDA